MFVDLLKLYRENFFLKFRSFLSYIKAPLEGCFYFVLVDVRSPKVKL